MNKTISFGPLRTSVVELRDITKAWLVLSLAFAFIYSGTHLVGGSVMGIWSFRFLMLFGVSLFTAGLGFLLHELSHKLVAQRYGCAAEFRAFDQMLFLALGLAFVIGFIFAAPGAVMISGMVTRKENGIISMAGPMMNFVLGLLFMGLTWVFPPWASLFSVGFSINMWLGLFNMIPFGPLDGVKIFRWNTLVWAGMVAFGVFFVFFV
ncbi:TPA: metalloprotease [Candidatus Woesearchaeota archaeon]|nr:metalloprotease [Candidatus Woesearchaeota archaeon]